MINQAFSLGDAIIRFFTSLSPYQLACLAVCVVAAVLAFYLVSKSLKVILRILAILALVYFLFPDFFARIPDFFTRLFV